jgi:hypothetical protein
MQKVQRQEPALEETRNSKVTVYLSFILLCKLMQLVISALRKSLYTLMQGKNKSSFL